MYVLHVNVIITIKWFIFPECQTSLCITRFWAEGKCNSCGLYREMRIQ